VFVEFIEVRLIEVPNRLRWNESKSILTQFVRHTSKYHRADQQYTADKTCVHSTNWCSTLYVPIYTSVPEDVTRPQQRYKVAYRTGQLPGASSNAPVYIQFFGHASTTQFYLLDNSFFAETPGEIEITVSHGIQALAGITIRAVGDDDWLSVGFITVRAENYTAVQFPTSIWFGAASGYKERPLFPFAVSKSILGINSQHKIDTVVRRVRYYRPIHVIVEVATANCESCGSAVDQQIQFLGEKGKSNFVAIKGPLKRGETVRLGMQIREDIGKLEAVRLQAGGGDGWMASGTIVVKIGGHFGTFAVGDFYLDDLSKIGASFYCMGRKRRVVQEVTLFRDLEVDDTATSSTSG
jgi:hypothetical protein